MTLQNSRRIRALIKEPTTKASKTKPPTKGKKSLVRWIAKTTSELLVDDNQLVKQAQPIAKPDFDIAGEGEANGQKVVVKGHVGREADGELQIVFSELGRPPAYSGKTELTLAPGERRVLRLPIIKQPDAQGNLETVVVIWIPTVIKGSKRPLPV